MGLDNPSEVEQARGTYRDCWREWRRCFSCGDLDGANNALVRADELAEQSAKAGRLEELLEPLLDAEEEPDIRGAAARHLLSNEVNEKALATLRELRGSDDPRVAKLAHRALAATSRHHSGDNTDRKHKDQPRRG